MPTLEPGDIVVMDNLGSHKSKAVRRAIRKAGARLFFLSKYWPDLKTIEQLFAKVKHWLRKAAKRTALRGARRIHGHAGAPQPDPYPAAARGRSGRWVDSI